MESQYFAAKSSIEVANVLDAKIQEYNNSAESNG